MSSSCAFPGLHLLVAMLQRGVDGSTPEAIPAHQGAVSRWVNPTERIQICDAEGRLLVEAGLLEKTSSGSCLYSLTNKGVVEALPHITYTKLNIREAIEFTLGLVYFRPAELLDGSTAIPAIYKPGKSRLILVLGENAGGKSFFRRLFRQVTHRGQERSGMNPEIPRGPFPVREFIPLCMQDRTGGGFASSLVYGSEDTESTGENSSRAISMGIRTVQKRAHPTIIWWDEPDIGMSAGAAAGAGILIRDFVASDAPLVQATCVTSHSPHMIHQLAKLDPHYIYLGDLEGPKDLNEWFQVQSNPVPVMPADLQERSRRRYRMLQKLLNRKD